MIFLEKCDVIWENNPPPKVIVAILSYRWFYCKAFSVRKTFIGCRRFRINWPATNTFMLSILCVKINVVRRLHSISWFDKFEKMWIQEKSFGKINSGKCYLGFLFCGASPQMSEQTIFHCKKNLNTWKKNLRACSKKEKSTLPRFVSAT